MFRCDNCGAEFDHSETVTESRDLGAESYQVCPMCKSTGGITEITEKQPEYIILLTYNGDIYWALDDLIVGDYVIVRFQGKDVIMDKLDDDLIRLKPAGYLEKFPKDSRVNIVGTAHYFEEDE